MPHDPSTPAPAPLADRLGDAFLEAIGDEQNAAAALARCGCDPLLAEVAALESDAKAIEDCEWLGYAIERSPLRDEPQRWRVTRPVKGMDPAMHRVIGVGATIGEACRMALPRQANGESTCVK